MGATHLSGPLVVGGKQLTGNAHITDVTVTASVTGADTVNAATVKTALNNLENKVNAILAALENAGILKTS